MTVQKIWSRCFGPKPSAQNPRTLRHKSSHGKVFLNRGFRTWGLGGRVGSIALLMKGDLSKIVVGSRSKVCLECTLNRT